MAINLIKKAQIKAQIQSQIRALLFDRALTAVLAECFSYSNVFSAENVAELLEHTGINNYIIKLKKSK